MTRRDHRLAKPVGNRLQQALRAFCGREYGRLLSTASAFFAPLSVIVYPVGVSFMCPVSIRSERQSE